MASIACPSCGEPNSEFNQRCAKCSTPLPLSTTQAGDEESSASARGLHTDPLVGKNLSHYRVLREIGVGGMGRVYAAEDTKLGRVVALKVLPPPLAEDPGRLERFQREAKAVAALNHPNIVTLHSVEEAEGLHFLTMELVEGRSLDELIPERGMPLEMLLDVAVPLAEALGAAHRRHILHRDLKPANIMRSDEGVVKVLDFGLAKLWKEPTGAEAGEGPPGTVAPDVGGLSSEVVTPPSTTTKHFLEQTTPLSKGMLTSQGRVLGTLPYMSPEQLQGTALDQRSDLFSLGVILYELATGRRPFQGKSAAALVSSILRDAPPPLAELRPDLPKHLSRIIERCLAKDSEKRFQTAEELCKALEALHRQFEGAFTRSWLYRHRRPVLAAAGALLALTGYGISQRVPRRDAAERAIPRVSALITWPSEEIGSRISPDGQWISFSSDASGAYNLWLQKLGGDQALPLTSQSTGGITGSIWSPDGTEIAYQFQQGTEELLQIVASTGGQPRLSKPVGLQDAQILRWIGPWIYLIGQSSLWRFHAETAALERVSGDSAFKLEWSADVSADEKQIVFSATRGDHQDLWVADLDGGNPVQVTDTTFRELYPRWLDRERRNIAYMSNRAGKYNLWRMSLADGLTEQLTFEEEDQQLEDGLLDGTFLTYRKTDQSSHIHGLELGTEHETQLTVDSRPDFWPSVADTGRVAFQRRSPGRLSGTFLSEAQIFVSAWEDGLLGSPRRLVDDGYWPRLSPDGRWLAYLRRTSGRNNSSNTPPGPEVRLQDLETQGSWSLGKGFPNYGVEPYPLGWITQNLNWARDSKAVYFVVESVSGIPEIWRFCPGPAPLQPERILSGKSPGEQLFDPLPSPDHRRLVYVHRTPDLTMCRIYEHDLISGTERLLLEQPMPRRNHLHAVGWIDDHSLLLLPWSRNPDDTARVNVLELALSGTTRVLGVAEHAFANTGLLDPAAQTLYLTRVENRIHNLFAFSLRDRSWRPLTQNKISGVTIAGTEVFPEGKLLYARQTRNNDLWMVQFDENK